MFSQWSQWKRPLGLALGVFALALTPTAGAQQPVVLGEVERGPFIDEYRLNGSVVARQRSDVSVPIGGLVVERLVEIGDRVERGDLLLRMDDELARLERERAQAEASEAQARLEEARRLAEEARSVGAGNNIARTELRRRESEVGIAEAMLQRTRASESLAAARVARHRITAPIDGVVSSRSIDVGQWVDPGTAVFSVVDTDELWLDFQAPQAAYPLLDESTSLRVQGYASQPAHEASIATWLPVTDSQARTFLLRARAPDTLSLTPGMAVSGVLRLAREQQMLWVHRDAVNRYPEGRTTVWVAQPKGDELYTVTEKRIEIAGTAGDQTYVSSGLTGDEMIVTRGNESLREGAEVELAERTAR
ncbi:RND family efflux transporter, MFP subunit [Halopseudomonas xinjiangensis]|uniref:RND family efflux transporter, MFP subunit n=1 Tax=Halopseudomonas xinjiangensis TaxID=487184 RepID=A0A1H1L6I5_9GAMM|nr:efflux RND transporter periplasmic adaptor subunit [Halopseudomonas xinjiangensis]SDR69950.1 RND family efflux transporter, MFP subunit [Halopseudomonas xinjiangensis]